jgi:hypothetical protein
MIGKPDTELKECSPTTCKYCLGKTIFKWPDLTVVMSSTLRVCSSTPHRKIQTETISDLFSDDVNC